MDGPDDGPATDPDPGDRDADRPGGAAPVEGIPVADFEAVVDALRAWCGDAGDLRRSTDEDRVVCDFGRASFAVAADGHVEGDMPLHGFDGHAERLVVEDDAVRVLGPDVEYVYRRP